MHNVPGVEGVCCSGCSKVYSDLKEILTHSDSFLL